MDYQLNKVIGIGIKFPIAISGNKRSQLLTLSTGKDRINESLHMLFHTRKGERYNCNEYGCDILNYVFEPNDVILKSVLAYAITEAIDRWEKRITLQQVRFTDETENTLYIHVEYIIKATNTPGSYVFPFMKEPMPFNEVIKGKQALAGLEI